MFRSLFFGSVAAIRKGTWRQACRRRRKGKVKNGPVPVATTTEQPRLPTEIFLRIIGYVGDRKLWNILTRMNKSIYHASKAIPAPWPDKAKKLLEQSFHGKGYDAFGVSYDSQWLLWAANNKEKDFSQIAIRIYNSRSGPQPPHIIHVMPTSTTFRGSISPNIRISKDCRYIAVVHRQEQAPIIRVYELRSSSRQLIFDPSNYFELVCPDPRVMYRPYLNRMALSVFSVQFQTETVTSSLEFQVESIEFDFSTSGNQLFVEYSISDSELQSIMNSRRLTTLWNLEMNEVVVVPAEISANVGEFLGCGDSFIVWTRDWTRSTSLLPLAWNFVSQDGVGLLGEYIAPNSFQGERPSHQRHGWSLNPIDQSLVAIIGERSPYQIVSEWIKSDILLLRLGNRDGPGRCKPIVAYNRLPTFEQELDGCCCGASLAWFPDGRHLAFIAEGKRIELFQIDREAEEAHEPSVASQPFKLIRKVNEFAARECKINGLPRGKNLKYITRFGVLGSGNILVLVVASFWGRKNPIPKETTYIFSV